MKRSEETASLSAGPDSPPLAGDAEVFPPPPLLAPRDLASALSFGLRLALDVRVSGICLQAVRNLPTWSGLVLDVGSGDGPWKWMLPRRATYIGLDVPLAETSFKYVPNGECKVIFDGRRFPLGANSVRHILCTEVLEHVEEPGGFLDECWRVTQPGGTCFFSVPFSARFHYVPHDYWRFTPTALVKLFSGAGWTDIAVTSIGTDVSVAAYKANALILKLLSTGSRSVAAKLLRYCGALALLPFFVTLTSIEIASALGHVGSPLDPLGYTVVARADKSR